MKTIARHATALHVALGILLTSAASVALAQNATRGKQLYENTNNAPLSCSAPGVCHGIDPNLNLNKIKNGSNANAIQAAINSVSTMAFLSTYLTSATDRADIAAYIANPAAAGGGGGGGVTLAASAAGFTWGATQVGSTNSSPSPGTITLSNGSASNIVITAINKSGTNAAEFTINGSCVSASPVTIAPGGSCSVGASFAPGATGTRTATLTVTSSAATNPSISLSGTGSSTPIASIALNRASIAFPTQTVATTSGAQSVTVTNSGSAMLTVTQVSTSPTPEFVSTNNCTTVLPGGSCSVAVVFTPAAAGTRSGTISITSNVGTSSIVLAGNAVLTPIPIATPDRTTLTFPQTLVNSKSAMSTLTFTNSGNAPMQISNVALGGADAAQFKMGSTTTCRNGTLAAFASCKVDMTFEPQSTGGKSASITISHNASGGATTTAVSGVGASATSSAMAPSNLGAGALSLWQLIVLAVTLLSVPPLRRRLARRR
jgi:HYDIN/CFA65/VesB family protein/centrosomal CEP192-like protein